ncbi:unnamed protein product [Rotaria sp. Silwood1]|nr:unnamed protein product [Rotaria sp. Silwood1]CAF5018773.1 unnamed protein product [Rotaria sp. Silwood1]
MSDSESTKESARPVTIDEESLIELNKNNTISDNIVIDKKRRQTIIPLSRQPKPIDATKGSDFDSNNGDNEDELEFDSFILTIPLLIEEDAKIKYFRNRNNIKKFDDFFEFLLTTYDVPEDNTRPFQSNPSSYSSNQNNFAHNSITHKTISFEDQQKITTNNFDQTDNLSPMSYIKINYNC